jgi:diguanylate cyclase (GGDEF)-like protein
VYIFLQQKIDHLCSDADCSKVKHQSKEAHLETVTMLMPTPSPYKRQIDHLINFIICANPIQRSAFLTILVFIVTTQYCFWALAMYYWPVAHQYLDRDVIGQFIPVGAGLVVGCLFFYVICRMLSQNTQPTVQFLIQTLIAIYYTLDMLFFGYLIGSMSMAAGAVLLGSPIFGLFLLESRAIYIALTVGIVTIVTLCSLSVYGIIPYAPVLIHSHPNDTSSFWLWSMMFFILPYWFIVCFLCDLIIKKLRQREADVRYMAEHDQLTGLMNRHSIDYHVKRIFSDYGHLCAVVLLDLDHFKQINDQFGHPCGDHVLKITAQVLMANVRKQDIVGRFGGEEFIILMEDTGLDEAETIAERIRKGLHDLQERHQDGRPIPISASFGVTSVFSGPDTHFEQLVQQADHALYQAKQQGRNRVCRYTGG